MRRLPGLATSFVLASALWAVPACAQDPIKIGFLGELSGPQAALGQDQYDGFMLFLDHTGGKLGGVPVEVLKEDTQLKPELAVQTVQRLIEKEHVPIITGVTFSNIMMAVQKPVTEAKVVLVGSNAGPSPIAGPLCSPYSFVTSFQMDTMAAALGRYANDKGYKRLYLMAPNYQAGKDFLAGFKEAYKGEIVDEIYTPLSQPDFSAELSQLVAAKPDAVFVFYPGALGINFVRQYQQAGLMQTIPLLSAGAVDGSTMSALKDTALGAFNVAPWGPDLDNPASKAFVAAFEAKYKRIPTMFAAMSYDTAQLLDSAIAKVKGDVGDHQAFLAAIKSADFPSVRGSFKFGTNNFPVQDYFVQEVAKDDKGRPSLKTVATPLHNVGDKYASQCKMK